MPRTINCHKITDLSHEETQSEIILQSNKKLELHIISTENQTVIRFPFGNKFDIIDGIIIIHEL